MIPNPEGSDPHADPATIAPEALDLATLVAVANTSAWVQVSADEERLAERARREARAVELGVLKRLPTYPERNVHKRYPVLGALGGALDDFAAVLVRDARRAPVLLSEVMADLDPVSVDIRSDIGDACSCHWTYDEDIDGGCERCGLPTDITFGAVERVREDMARQWSMLVALGEDLDALHDLVVRSVLPRIGGAPVEPPKPRTGSPLDILDAHAERITNAATADVEALLRDAVGAMYWPLKRGHVTPEHLAEVLLAAATARGRMERTTALGIIGGALKP